MAKFLLFAGLDCKVSDCFGINLACERTQNICDALSIDIKSVFPQ
jgi:hypothetical protein